MLYVGIGAVGFLVAYLMDMMAVKAVPGGKPLVGLLAAALVSFAMTAATLNPDRVPLAAPLHILGGFLLLIAVALMVFSLFVNLPFRKVYVSRGVTHELVKTGTYALVRHPGVPWYGLLLISLFLLSGSRLLLVAAPVWFVMDLIHVTIQERFFFVKMFAGYDRYQVETPMLIPNKRSLQACLRTIGRPEHDSTH